MSKTETSKAGIREWQALAEKELRERPLGELEKETESGLKIKPLYTELDLEGVEHLGTMPGIEPYLRGPRAKIGRASCRERV